MFGHNGAKMSQLGSKDAKQRYKIPSDMSVHDFVRRAVAEAKLIIAELDKPRPKMDAPELAQSNSGFRSDCIVHFGSSADS